MGIKDQDDANDKSSRNKSKEGGKVGSSPIAVETAVTPYVAKVGDWPDDCIDGK